MGNKEELLRKLDDELDKKCFEIKKIRTENRLKSLFAALSLLFLIIPVLLVLFNIFTFSFAMILFVFLLAMAAVCSPFIILFSFRR